MPESGINQRSDEGETFLDRRTIDSITSYEVTEDQLVIMQNGESSNELNFAISLISIFVSLIVTLSTTQIIGDVKNIAFWSATFVSGTLGTFFLIAYIQKRRSSKNIFVKIREQKSTRALRDNAAAVSPVTEISNEHSSSEESS